MMTGSTRMPAKATINRIFIRHEIIGKSSSHSTVSKNLRKAAKKMVLMSNGIDQTILR
jgi:hypothetical protein